MKNKKNINHALSSLIMWLGLLTCSAFALKSPDLFDKAQKIASFKAFILVFLIWWCAIMTWRNLVKSFFGINLHFVDSARHFAKLQIGKYVPGGIWGFLARQNDAAMPEFGQKSFFVGAAEQLLGLFCVAMVGASVYSSALTKNYFFILVIFIIPWLNQYFLQVSFYMISQIRYFTNIEYNRYNIIVASIYGVFQQIVTLALLVYFADSLLQIFGWDAFVLTGAYLISVVIGMLFVFAPGGIFVREAVFVFLAQDSIGTNDALIYASSLRILFFLADILYAILAFLLHAFRKSAN
jgi:hypothetical protein